MAGRTHPYEIKLSNFPPNGARTSALVGPSGPDPPLSRLIGDRPERASAPRAQRYVFGLDVSLRVPRVRETHAHEKKAISFKEVGSSTW